MNKKTGQSLIALTLSMLALFGCKMATMPVIAQTKPPQSSTGPSAKQLTSLTKDSDWKTLASIWKQLNHLKTTKDFKKNQLEAERLYQQYQKVPGLLGALVSKKLISTAEKDFLQTAFKERHNFLYGHLGLTTCYAIAPQESEVLNNRISLEERYDTIEKLYTEKKINASTYEAAKKNITDNLVVIEKVVHQKGPDAVKPDFVNLLILLNQ